METVKIQVVFEETIGGITYRDALYYPDLATYEAKKADGSHEAEKQTRVANFDYAMKNPAPATIVTKEQLQAEKASLEAQIAELDVKISEKGSK
jgi:hypothetical protein